MKHILIILFIICASICCGQNINPQALLDSFWKHPERVESEFFFPPENRELRKVNEHDTLYIFTKEMYMYDCEFTYSKLVTKQKVLSYSLTFEYLLEKKFDSKRDLVDTLDRYVYMILKDTLKSLFYTDYLPPDWKGDTAMWKYYLLLSAFSGLDYGTYGTIGGRPHRNNLIFNSVIESVSPNELYLLLCASNPLVRTQAAMYYCIHKRKFRKFRSTIKPIIERIIHESTLIRETSAGCIVPIRAWYSTPGQMISEVKRGARIMKLIFWQEYYPFPY